MTAHPIAVPEADLDDLRDRLRRARWPEPATAEGWAQGVPLEYLRDLCAHWAAGYDWRATEARLNRWAPQTVDAGGLGIHLLHARSPEPGALPLVLTHGWPGSVVEFLDVLSPLSDPAAHGGDPADAFHVVCPSLPGYGFSAKPARPGWGVERTADAWAAIMAGLGYDRYGAAGSDWGTTISTLLGRRDAAHVAGILVVPPLAAPDPATLDDLTPGERRALDDLARRSRDGSGYSEVQATRPQTIGYALVDSPVGLCAWIAEKLVDWSDTTLTRDQVLDDVMMYWLPGTGASAARLYWESIRLVSGWFTEAVTDTVDVPTGCSIFPAEVPRASRRWAERRFTDIRHWHELDRGGHFAAFEEPALFVDELRTFFRQLR
ncbi:MAG TPA: epoxide hydrolase [Acidimicrobiales bacterium]|nr:epoxide hydrolase [Acidimicrobiales bacterium]